jgi:UDP-glucose 4-epimerase
VTALLVAGASGFIGRSFLLQHSGDYEITALYRRPDFPDFVRRNSLKVRLQHCDLTLPDSVDSAVKAIGRKWDACLLLASRVDIPRSVADPASDVLANVYGPLSLMTRIECRRLVYLSSGAVYEGLKGPVGPHNAVSPTLPYAINKLATEQYVRYCQVRRASVGEFVNVRFFGAYGPQEPSHKVYMKLVQTFGLRCEREIHLYGDGKNLVDAMYIDDAVRGLDAVVRGTAANLTVDFCGGQPLSVRDLAVLAARTFGVHDANIVFGNQAHEYNSFHSSGEAFATKFGVTPAIPLEQGLVRFAQWLGYDAA